MSTYNFIESQKSFSNVPTSLFLVEPISFLRRQDGLIVASFAEGTYEMNLRAMKRPYTFSTFSGLTFRAATTAESLDVLASRPSGFDTRIRFPRTFQLGRIARTSEGVFVNVLGTEDGATLDTYLEGAQEVNGIYVKTTDNVAFVPYGSFKKGLQDVGEFSKSGLARGLELATEGAAIRLATIGNAKSYPEGVNVIHFEPAKKGEVLHTVTDLGSTKYFEGNMRGEFHVRSGDWQTMGFAFGVAVNNPVDCN